MNISCAWHGSLAGQVAFSVAVLHLLLQERPMLGEQARLLAGEQLPCLLLVCSTS